MKVSIILSLLIAQCLGNDRVNQYRQQLAQAGTDEQAFIDASVEAKLLTEQQIQNAHPNSLDVDQKQMDAVWRHNFKTTRFFKLYKQHRADRQQKKILIDKKREELFNIQKNYDQLNKQYQDLEVNYIKNKKIQKKILRDFPQGAKVIQAFKNRPKIQQKKAAAIKLESSESVPIRPLRLPKVEKVVEKYEQPQAEKQQIKTEIKKNIVEHSVNIKKEVQAQSEQKKVNQPEKVKKEDKPEDLGLNMTVGGNNVHVAQKQIKLQAPKQEIIQSTESSFEDDPEQQEDLEISQELLPINLRLAQIQRRQLSQSDQPLPIAQKLASIKSQKPNFLEFQEIEDLQLTQIQSFDDIDF